MNSLLDQLLEFKEANGVTNKGWLCVALVVTRHAKAGGLPLEHSKLVTDGGGQVLGLGRTAVQAILGEHGMTKVLSKEGGRTSRGSIGNMKLYAAFLNGLHEAGILDLEAVEKWWIDQVKVFLKGKPFVLRLDSAKSIRSIVTGLLNQAIERQKQDRGATYAGTMMQHLVGAKLDVILGGGVEHHGASVADDGIGREGDFLLGDTAIHVTTAPSELLIQKCVQNISGGLRPLIISLGARCSVAEGLADNLEIGDRVDVLEVTQFLSSNIHEHGRFEQNGRRASFEEIIKRYNEIVDLHETDPSLRISIGR